MERVLQHPRPNGVPLMNIFQERARIEAHLATCRRENPSVGSCVWRETKRLEALLAQFDVHHGPELRAHADVVGQRVSA